MASIVPSRVEDLLPWAEEHATLWTAATGIGLTPAQTTLFSAAVGAAQSAQGARVAARTAYDSASLTAADAVRDLRTTAADMIRFIRAYAESQAKPAVVYAAAGLPAPAAPVPLPPPGTPQEFTLGVDQIGRLELKWKCKNPPGATGTVYLIERRLNETGDFGFTAAVGERKFIDATVPFGTNIVDYRITAQRAELVGLPGTWTVRFGAGAGGGQEFTVMQVGGESPARLAA